MSNSIEPIYPEKQPCGFRVRDVHVMSRSLRSNDVLVVELRMPAYEQLNSWVREASSSRRRLKLTIEFDEG